jgi:hypothetical protein
MKIKNQRLLIILATLFFVISCKKSNSSVKYPGFRAVSCVLLCPGTPVSISAADEVFISFANSSYRPQPNTWYKTEFNIWYKVGSDISVVNAPMSFEVLEQPHAVACQ